MKVVLLKVKEVTPEILGEITRNSGEFNFVTLVQPMLLDQDIMII